MLTNVIKYLFTLHNARYNESCIDELIMSDWSLLIFFPY